MKKENKEKRKGNSKNTKGSKKSLKKKRELIAVYYYRDKNTQLDWETHLKLYMGNWEACPTAYIFEKEFKHKTPKQALKEAIQDWKKTTGIDPTDGNHHFSIMISKTEDMYLGLKSVTGKEIEDYLR